MSSPALSALREGSDFPAGRCYCSNTMFMFSCFWVEQAELRTFHIFSLFVPSLLFCPLAPTLFLTTYYHCDLTQIFTLFFRCLFPQSPIFLFNHLTGRRSNSLNQVDKSRRRKEHFHSHVFQTTLPNLPKKPWHGNKPVSSGAAFCCRTDTSVHRW